MLTGISRVICSNHSASWTCQGLWATDSAHPILDYPKYHLNPDILIFHEACHGGCLSDQEQMATKSKGLWKKSEKTLLQLQIEGQHYAHSADMLEDFGARSKYLSMDK